MNATTQQPKLCVLFVDDEKRLVETYADIFGEEFEVHIATSGHEGLQVLPRLNNLAVVMSDFHMPEMDGASFLHEVMQRAPLATRVLLTGTAGIGSAKEAVNKGQIFRFLTKPCPLEQLRGAMSAAVAQYRLMNAERRVLQETLIECISALMEVLAVTNPVAFGRAQRIKDLVQGIAARLDCAGFWQLEAAAMLSQLGYFAVSPELAEKIYYGRPLDEQELERAATVPANARRLLEHVPRLEPVTQILAALDWSDADLARAGDRMVGLGARILGATLEYDILINKGMSKGDLVQKLRGFEARFGKKVIEAIEANFASLEETGEHLTIPLRQARPGMRLKQELRTPSGALLVPIGIEVSPRLLDRISQVAPALLDQPARLAPARA
ncbi:MAG TPA: HD domain-containing phosphohydrolase [Steroidobacteraceae bacterium]|nr:HD domain-containing phosphohydrolase [Steroidobacteraceae bacterium]